MNADVGGARRYQPWKGDGVRLVLGVVVVASLSRVVLYVLVWPLIVGVLLPVSSLLG